MTVTPQVDLGMHPVTQIIHAPEGDDTRIAHHAVRWTSTEEYAPNIVEMLDLYDGRTIFLTEITVDLPGQLEGMSWPSNNRIEYRETTESDVVAAGWSSYPWPLPVIKQMTNNASLGQGASYMHLEALADDDGNVMTVMQVSGAGIWLRYSGAWVELANPDTIEDWGAVEVDDSALAMYDAFDQNGQTTTLFQLPVKDVADLVPYRGDAVIAMEQTGMAGSGDGGIVHNPPLISERDAPEAITPLRTPVIEEARDVPGAIELALHDPTHRWYVERRIKALGLDYNLPWEPET